MALTPFAMRANSPKVLDSGKIFGCKSTLALTVQTGAITLSAISEADPDPR
jgi:hypothetical protein